MELGKLFVMLGLNEWIRLKNLGYHAEYYTEYYVESYGSLQLEAAEVLNYKKLTPSRFKIICKNLHPGVFSSLVKTCTQ